MKKDLIHLETSGNRHWLSRTKVNTKWAIVEKLGKDDYLVEWDVNEAGLPSTWTLRAIRYQKKGFTRATLLTSLLDPEQYPAEELVALYHERWETELAYDEVKTHMLDCQESIRSKTPDGVRQELWGIALAYNLVRVEMERAAAEAGVPPTRISFVAALAMIRDEFRWLGSPRVTPGAVPASLQRLRRQLKPLVLPPRRPDRSYPRAVKLKMSNYPRKRLARRAGFRLSEPSISSAEPTLKGPSPRSITSIDSRQSRIRLSLGCPRAEARARFPRRNRVHDRRHHRRRRHRERKRERRRERDHAPTGEL